jgi:hypothetical protein
MWVMWGCPVMALFYDISPVPTAQSLQTSDILSQYYRKMCATVSMLHCN